MTSRKHPPTRTLRDRPDLAQLKRQAKELLQAFAAGEADAAAEVNAHYQGANPASFALHDAQLVLARSYGFDSWPKLKAFVDGVTVRRTLRRRARRRHRWREGRCSRCVPSWSISIWRRTTSIGPSTMPYCSGGPTWFAS